jgi:hypothetical protein
MAERIDRDREDDARAICEFVTSRVRADGRYHPPEAMNPESVLYRGTLAATVALAGESLDEDRYVEAAGRMLDRVVDERVDGLWSVGRWVAYPTYRPVPVGWREVNETPQHRATALVLYCLGVYRAVSGDERFTDLAGEAVAGLFDRWDVVEERDTVYHGTPEMAAMAVCTWEDEYPEYADRRDRIVDWAADTCAAFAEDDVPFFVLYRFLLLLLATDTAHLQAVRPAIDAILEDPDRRFDDSNDFRHTANTDDHVDVRANGAVATLLRLYDLAAGEPVYTDREVYRHLEGWMDGMRTADGRCYGCRSFDGSRRYGLGSPPHYVQLWWLLGGFLPPDVGRDW